MVIDICQFNIFGVIVLIKLPQGLHHPLPSVPPIPLLVRYTSNIEAVLAGKRHSRHITHISLREVARTDEVGVLETSQLRYCARVVVFIGKAFPVCLYHVEQDVRLCGLGEFVDPAFPHVVVPQNECHGVGGMKDMPSRIVLRQNLHLSRRTRKDL